MKSLSVLVADDEENIRGLLENWLVAAGHVALSVGSAKEAFGRLKQRSFDLVITDMLMPEGDGLDLIRDMKKAQPTARIIAISGGGQYVDRDYCLRLASGLGVQAVVMKPFTWPQLQAGIEQAMAATPAPTPPSSST